MAKAKQPSAKLGKATALRSPEWRRHGGDVRGRLSYARKRPARVLQCAHCRGIAHLFSATAKQAYACRCVAQQRQRHPWNRNGTAMLGQAAEWHRTGQPRRNVDWHSHDMQRQGRAKHLQATALQRKSSSDNRKNSNGIAPLRKLRNGRANCS